jgi:hypothetical protein
MFYTIQLQTFVEVNEFLLTNTLALLQVNNYGITSGNFTIFDMVYGRLRKG